mgnify:CR=1 FL=1
MAIDKQIQNILDRTYVSAFTIRAKNNHYSSTFEDFAQHLPALTHIRRLTIKFDARYGHVPARLPEAIHQLEQLEELVLERLEFETLPAKLGQLPNLRILKVLNCKIPALPKSWCSLTQLEQLVLEDLPSLTDFPSFIPQFRQLKVLIIKGCGLGAVPDALADLVELKQLDLSGNQLPHLPMRLHELTALESLNVSDNQLQALPERLLTLPVLRMAQVRENQLLALPAPSPISTKLWLLDACDNQLTEVPAALLEAPNLEKLLLSNNQLQQLPAIKGNMAALKHLSLTNNQFKTLPFLAKAPLLRYLHLDHNQLETLPEVFDALPQLEQLKLNHNPLAALPDSLQQAERLKKLYLTHTNLPTYPPLLHQLNVLWELTYPSGWFSFVFPLKIENLLKEGYRLGSERATPQQKASLLQLLTQENAELSNSTLLELHATKHSGIQHYIRQRLFQQKELVQHPLQVGAEVVALGNFTQKKTAIKERVQAAGLGYKTRITKNTYTKRSKLTKRPICWKQQHKKVV